MSLSNTGLQSEGIVRLREFAARYTKAWCSRNAAGVAAHFSPQGSLTINHGRPAVGRGAIAEAAQSFMTAFPDLCVAMNDLVINGDRVEYHWTLTGTNDGPGGTGNLVRISGFEAWEMSEDGLIAASQGSFDEADYQRQLQQGSPTP
jgi:nuclear transport factor 2 (NTF2) superfamily protein